MNYSKRIYKKNFSGENAKEAYLKGCKWLYQNVLSREDEIGELTYSFKRLPDSLPTFELSLYVSLAEGIVNKENCEICKETHNLFYANQVYNCNSCREQAYRKRMEGKLSIKAQYAKERIKRAWDE